jgi:uncharacterized protein YbaR (Trm112 family)
MLNNELLKIICCPVDHGDLIYSVEKNILTCKICNKIYKIENDIPIMLVDENENKQ